MTKLAGILDAWQDEPVAEIRILATRGSTPREADAFMLVTRARTFETIGGGRLEQIAIDAARRLLDGETIDEVWQIPLGPAINQCCGGHVTLRITRVLDPQSLRDADRRRAETRPTILLFGAGHVGRALAQTLGLLPFRTLWIDPRPEEFNTAPPPNVEPRITADFQGQIDAAPRGSGLLILTHSHTLDALILDAALQRPDFAYVGLIGSLSKRRRFEAALRAQGHPPASLARLTCPIGQNPTRDKRPEIIAAFTAAEITRALLSPSKPLAPPDQN